MIRGTILLLLGLAVSSALRHRPAALRHLVLAAALMAAVLMPAAERLSPRWHLGLLPAPAPAPLSATLLDMTGSGLPGSTTDTPTAAASAPGRFNTPSLVWAAGSLVSLLLLLAGIGRMLLIARRARHLSSGPWVEAASLVARRSGLARVPTLYQSSHSALLFTWGLRRPRVLLPRGAMTWSQDRIETVLAHELAHVQRGDWAVQLFAEAARCLYWFNPAMWLVCRRLRLESELAADAAVLRLGVTGPDYAAHLVELARLFRRTSPWFLPAPAMARASDLERRVRLMLNERLNRSSVTRSSGVLVLTATMTLALSVASLSLDAASNPLPPASVRPGDGVPALPGVSAAFTSTRPSAPLGRRTGTPAAAPRAQAGPAQFTGRLVDQQGRAVPAVPLTLASLSGTSKLQTTTDAAGQFTFADTPGGVYRLTARKPGFQADCGAVNLVAGKLVRQDVVLQLGQLTQQVDVSGVRGGVPTSVPVARHVGKPLAVDPCAESAVGGCVTPPTILVSAAPVYPANHQMTGQGGAVLIQGRIGVDGQVVDMEPEPGSDPDFAKVAMQAIRLWQFSPTRLGGTPVEIRFAVKVNFTIATE